VFGRSRILSTAGVISALVVASVIFAPLASATNPPYPYAVTGTVVSPSSTPLSGVGVQAWTTAYTSPVSTTTTNASGQFTLSISGLSTSQNVYISIGGMDEPWVPQQQAATLRAYVDVTPVHLAEMAYVSQAVTVSVPNYPGAPSGFVESGVTVSVSVSGAGAAYVAGDPYLASTCVTDSTGSCTLNGPGSDLGYAISQGYLNVSYNTSVGGPVLTSSNWDGSSSTITLPPVYPIYVAGTLYAPDGVTPLPNTEILLGDKTDANGHFDVPVVPCGSCQYYIFLGYSAPWAPQLKSLNYNVPLGTTETFNTTAVAYQSQTFTVTVKDGAGNPIPGAVVSPVNVDPSSFFGQIIVGDPYISTTCTTDSTGQCQLTGPGADVGAEVKASQLAVSFSAALGSSVIGTATWNGTATTIAIAGPSPFSVTGTITTPSATPLASAVVELFDSSTGTIQSTTTDSSGKYSFEEPLSRLGDDVQVFIGGYAEPWAPQLESPIIPVTGLGTSVVENFSEVAYTSAPVTVTVLDASGRPVVGATVGSTVVGSPPLVAGDTYLANTCTTDSLGTCSLVGPSGIEVTFPVRLTASVASSVVGSASWDGSLSAVTITTGTKSGVSATVPTPAGVLRVVASAGTAVTGAGVSTPSVKLPSSLSAPVGSVAYSVTGLTKGASTQVSLYVPGKSNVNGLIKYMDGTYVDVSPFATFSGHDATLSIADGGPLDGDHKVNGVVVDPVLPVSFKGSSLSEYALSATLTAPKVGATETISVKATGFTSVPVSTVELMSNGRVFATLHLRSGRGLWRGHFTTSGVRDIVVKAVSSSGVHYVSSLVVLDVH